MRDYLIEVFRAGRNEGGSFTKQCRLVVPYMAYTLRVADVR